MKFIFILLLFLNEFFENFVINDVLKEVIAKLHNGLCYNNLSCQTPPPPHLNLQTVQALPFLGNPP